MRTTVTVTPVDEETADIRSTVWLDRLPGDDSPHQPASLEHRQRMANNQYLADLNIWQHKRYTDPPALATAEAIEAAKRGERKERKALSKAEAKARRDARYAARKARRS